jgi:hypothetical protein
MSSNHALRALALATLAGGALAQSPNLVLRVGDAIPGAGKITDIEVVEVSAGGTWSALVHTDDPVAHTVLYAYGVPYVKVGDHPQGLGGASLAALDAPTWDLFQIPHYIARVNGGSSQQAVMHDETPVLLSGQPATTHTIQLPAGSVWRRFDELHVAWADAGILLRGAIDDPLAGKFDQGLAAVAWFVHAGVIGFVDVVALEGQLAPGLARTIEEVRAGPCQARLSRSAMVALWSCDLDGSTSDDSCVYRTPLTPQRSSLLLAREGSPSPVAGRTWGSLEDHALDFSFPSFAWTLRGRLDSSDLSNDEVLVLGSTVVAREGDVLPATAPHALESLGLGRGALDENGRVLWYGAWDDPSTPGPDEALFQDQIPLVRTGVTLVEGSVLVDIEAGPRSYSLDPQHGRFAVFVGSLADGTRGVCLLDQGAMEVYCLGKKNSAGLEPSIYWTGQPPSATVGSGFEIKAGALMAKSPALFFYGLDGPLALPFHGGTLCVQPPLQRGPLVNTNGTTGPTGHASIDFNAWIASGVDPRLVAGVRVHMQLWYRDSGFAPPDDVGLTPGLRFQIAQ